MGAKVWVDEEEMAGRVIATMFQGIDDSSTLTVFVTEEYTQKVAGTGRNGVKDNCLKEFEYAEHQKGSGMMIPVVMEAAMVEDAAKWRGPVGLLASKIQIRGWGRPAEDVAREITATLAKLVPEFRASQEYIEFLNANKHDNFSKCVGSSLASAQALCCPLNVLPHLAPLFYASGQYIPLCDRNVELLPPFPRSSSMFEVPLLGQLGQGSSHTSSVRSETLGTNPPVTDRPGHSKASTTGQVEGPWWRRKRTLIVALATLAIIGAAGAGIGAGLGSDGSL